MGIGKVQYRMRVGRFVMSLRHLNKRTLHLHELLSLYILITYGGDIKLASLLIITSWFLTNLTISVMQKLVFANTMPEVFTKKMRVLIYTQPVDILTAYMSYK